MIKCTKWNCKCKIKAELFIVTPVLKKIRSFAFDVTTKSLAKTHRSKRTIKQYYQRMNYEILIVNYVTHDGNTTSIFEVLQKLLYKQTNYLIKHLQLYNYKKY